MTHTHTEWLSLFVGVLLLFGGLAMALALVACEPHADEDRSPVPLPTLDFALPTSERRALHVQTDEDHVITLHSDETVTWSEGMDADEAARTFLQALKIRAPDFFCREGMEIR